MQVMMHCLGEHVPALTRRNVNLTHTSSPIQQNTKFNHNFQRNYSEFKEEHATKKIGINICWEIIHRQKINKNKDINDENINDAMLSK